MEMYTPITAFSDVPHDPVNADGVDVELLAHSFQPFSAEKN
jgi:hypothetical protein